MIIRPGTKLRSAVSTVELIVVKAPATEVDLGCGGSPMLAGGDPVEGAAPDPALSEAVNVGKRYSNEEIGLEVLCTKAGTGTLTVNGEVLLPKEAKPLPASD
jgi:hypothetical protein